MQAMKTDDDILNQIFGSPELPEGPRHADNVHVPENIKEMERRAINLAVQNNLNESINEFSVIIEEYPSYYSAYNNRAQVYRIKEDNEAALKDLDFVCQSQNVPIKVSKQAFTQRAILKKKLNYDQEETAIDFAKGARLGNEIAKQVVVQSNPYAKLCNAMIKEILEKEKY